MSIQEIEEAITRLPARDVAKLMAWLAEYHAQLWDRQIEEDLEAGRLDGVLAAVDEEDRAGLAKPQAPKSIGPALDPPDQGASSAISKTCWKRPSPM